MKIDHIAIVVKDIERAKEFFVDLGFEVKKQDKLEGEWIDTITGLKDVKAEFVALSLPGKETNLELLTFYNPKGIVDPNISNPNQIGFRHIALAIENIEEYYQRFKSKGIKLLSEIQKYGTGKKLFYFIGPEGVIIEIAEYS